MTYLAAVLGNPIAHSLSPLIHQEAFRDAKISDHIYKAVQLSQTEFSTFLAQEGGRYQYFSVTMPLKDCAFSSANVLSTEANHTQTVNIILRNGENWHGYNTDVTGIIRSLQAGKMLQSKNGKKNIHPTVSATVFGAGATARSAVYALANLGVKKLNIVARNITKTGSAATLAKTLGLEVIHIPLESTQDSPRLDHRQLLGALEAEYIVQTLPAPVIDSLDIFPVKNISSALDSVFLDVVYSPQPRPIEQIIRSKGIYTVSGIVMILEQAWEQLYLAIGLTPKRSRLYKAVYDAQGMSDPSELIEVLNTLSK